MKKSIKVILICIFFLILVSVKANAGVGISPSKVILNFESYLNESVLFTIFVDQGRNVELAVRGDLAEYVTLNKDFMPGSGSVIATLNLPKELEKPGRNRIFIEAKENAPGGMIGGRVAVAAPIDIMVPYPGKYIEANFYVNDVNVGEPINFVIQIKNLGKENLLNIGAVIDVYDDENIIKTLLTNKIMLKTTEEGELKATLDSNYLKSGRYRAVATISYDGEKLEIEKEFRVGTLFIEIVDYTKEFEQGKINKFDIEIESKWNNKLQEVYGAITIENTAANNTNTTLKTPNTELKPWERKTISAYWDTTDVKLGSYDAVIELFYEEQKTTKLAKLYVIKPRHVELPISTATIILIAIIILIIALDFIWWRHSKKSAKPKQKNKKIKLK